MDDPVKEFTDLLVQIWKAHGLDDLSAKVIALLYSEPGEISLEEVAKKTGYSLASISNTVKSIENLGLITRLKKSKSKKVYVFMEKDMCSLKRKWMQKVYQTEILPALEKLPKLLDEFRPHAKKEESKQKLAIMENYYKQMKQFEIIMKAFDKELQNQNGKGKHY